ncbi:MAG: biopolymer transporter ExbD [Pseudomonadota bacterium]
MPIDFAQRRRKYPSLTSLIDIIFLLLLFFMLSSTFSKYTEVQVTAVQSGGGQANERPELFISLSGDTWRVNGEEASFANVSDILERYRSEKQAKAILRVTDTATSQNLIDAVELLNREKIQVTLVR